jgi:hypothetical protein
VAAACETALQARAISSDYVLNVLSRSRPGTPAAEVTAPQTLSLREPPRADLSRYDRLLRKRAGELTMAAIMVLNVAGNAMVARDALVGVEHGAS